MWEPLVPGEVTACGTLAWWFNSERGGGGKLPEQVDFDIGIFNVAWYGLSERQDQMKNPPSLSPWKGPALSSLAPGKQVPPAPTAERNKVCLSCWSLLICLTSGTRLCEINASISPVPSSSSSYPSPSAGSPEAQSKLKRAACLWERWTESDCNLFTLCAGKHRLKGLVKWQN